MGFRYIRDGDEFDHPLGLVILSPQGKIVRYMTGHRFPARGPEDVALEASTGTVGPTIARVLRFCFSYDPQNKKMVFNVLKVAAIVTLTVAAALGPLPRAGRPQAKNGREGLTNGVSR